VEFFVDPGNLILIVVAIGSGLMLTWPMIQRSRAGSALSPAETVQMINRQHAVLVDIRNLDAYNAGHIPQARHIPVAEFDKKAASLPKNKPVILVCDLGRSAIGAAKKLRALGLAEVTTLDGGMRAWSSSDLPVTGNKSSRSA
jgi:rhodanese-related sulfurtransferase